MKKLLAFLLVAQALFAIGSATQTTNQQGNTGNYVVAIQWTGDASDGSVPAIPLQGLAPLQGYFVNSIESKPMTPAPTSGYTIRVTDASGYDILGGQGTPLSSTASAAFLAAGATPPLNGTLTVLVTGNSVASAKGTIYVFLVKPNSAGGSSSFINGRYFRIPVNYSSATVDGITNVNGSNIFGLKSMVNGQDPQAERLVASNVPGTTTDAVDGGIAIPSTSTQLEGKAMFGTMTNASTATNGVAGQFFARASGPGTGTGVADRVRIWGMNVLVEDGSPLGGAPYTGYDWIYMTNEWDFNVFNTKTQIYGHSIGGNGSVQPQVAYGFLVNSLSVDNPGTALWNCGFCTLDGTASVALQVGTTGQGNSVGSQPILLYGRDAGGFAHGAAISADLNGNLLIEPGFTGPVGSNEQTIFLDSAGTIIASLQGSVGGATPVLQGGTTTRFQPGSVTYAQLAAAGVTGGGSRVYCSDCTVNATPPHTCANGGTGANVFSSGGALKCPF